MLPRKTNSKFETFTNFIADLIGEEFFLNICFFVKLINSAYLFKFSFSEKATKIWCNLPQGFEITYLQVSNRSLARSILRFYVLNC